jgi:tetraacyldisaccharide 4'-kinase
MRRTPAARPLLLPLTPLYRLLVGLRELRLARGWEQVRRLERPVVSIGNISTGGAGKTPLAIALAQALTRRGVAADVLSRGYGRASKLAVRVDPEGTAAEFGDEPLLIARAAGVPVYVARQRFDAGLMAEAAQSTDEEPASRQGTASAVPQRTQEEGALALEGCAFHLLDDGFQHRQLHRDVDIVLVSAADLRDRLLPAGNLREPLAALNRATVMAIPADEPETEAGLRALGWQGPVWRVRRQMETPAIDGPAVAFCGIARPQQFFAGLEATGLHLASRIAFADHHAYKEHDMDCIKDAVRSTRAVAVLTTQKDLVRLGALAETLPSGIPLRTVPLRTLIEDEDACVDWLLQRLPQLDCSGLEEWGGFPPISR